jgi:uncharacterized protein (DUF488 family)
LIYTDEYIQQSTLGYADMFYRRKILLALIEVFGGVLKRTDCQKLLFLFCQQTKRNYYDFFPYKFGAFSQVVYQDKRRLTMLGLLCDQDDFEVATQQSFFAQLKKKDQTALMSLALNCATLTGTPLIHKTYMEYPEYTCRSTILSEVLSPQKINQVRFSWNMDESPCLFTIGYQGRTIDAYLNALIANNIQALLDVRKRPQSMKYGFSKTRFRNYVESAGLTYVHIPDLGILSELRQHLDTPEDYTRLFEYYQTEILPGQTQAVREVEALLSEHSRIALTCFEADYHFCHRHKITECIKNISDFTTPIVHL